MLVLGSFVKQKTEQIAVIEIDGAIGMKVKPAEFAKLFRSLEDNHHVRAVVLDIDSPGGSASGSDYLYIAAKSLGRKKPVIAFIRGTGASGAYMLACAGERIVTTPSALIGSIGVISIRPLVHEALDRLNLRMHVTKSDRLKDMGSMFRAPTEEEEQKEQALVNELYEHFIDIVAEGRPIDRDAVRALATGEIFTGRRSQEVGLADEVGDLDRAIDIAAELGQTARKPIWVRPRRGLREMVASFAATTFVDAVANRFEEHLRPGVYYRSPY